MTDPTWPVAPTTATRIPSSYETGPCALARTRPRTEAGACLAGAPSESAMDEPRWVGLDGWGSMGGARWVGLDGWGSMGGARWVSLDG
jgi:hypothetical protein